jgi:hypothetical protein
MSLEVVVMAMMCVLRSQEQAYLLDCEYGGEHFAEARRYARVLN